MTFSADWNQTPALVVALTTLLIAGLSLQRGHRVPANQFFAFFLLTIAGNFGARFLGAGFLDQPTLQSSWERVGLVFLIWDPAVLVYFASLFPAPTYFARTRPALIALGLVPASLTLLLFAQPGALEGTRAYGRVILLAYVVLAYTYCLLLLTRRAGVEDHPAPNRQAEFLLLGLSVALVPRFGLLVDDLGLFGLASSPGRVLARIAMTWFLFAAVVAYGFHQARPARRPRIAWVFRRAGLFIGVLTAFWLTGLALAQQYEGSADFGINHVYAFRWILFSLIVGYAIARYQVFDIELRLWRYARTGLPALVALLVFFISLDALDPAGSDDATRSAILAAAIALPIGFLLWWQAPRLARGLRPHGHESESYLHARKLEVYGAQLLSALRSGGPSTDEGHFERLRRDLGLSLDEHGALERLFRSVPTAMRLEDRIATGQALFGRYRVQRRLDRGGFADVFIATDVQADRPVVLKRLRPGYLQDEQVVASFLREAQIAAKIRHPNVVRVHEVVQDSGEMVLVLDYVEGGTLEEAMRGSGPFASDRAVAIARDVLQGLQAAHAAGVFHRDLKPANILLDANGRALITDFGVAHVPNLEQTVGGLTGSGGPPGTVSYMAPEQALGRPVDGRADVYAVGVILWEIATGKRLYPPKDHGEFELRQRVSRGVSKSRIQEAPVQLRPLLAKALATDPDNRFRTPEEMREALDEDLRKVGGRPAARNP